MTLEEAAEELLARVRDLDSEMEATGSTLEDLRDRLEAVAEDLEHERAALADGVMSFLDTMRREQEAVDRQAEETLQAVGDGHQALVEEGATARDEIARGRGQLEGVGQHAAGLEPGLDSLVAEAGEAPARSLTESVHELEQELERAVHEARGFLCDEVVPALEQVATDVRERCHELHRLLAEEETSRLQDAFVGWEAELDRLEEHVALQGFQASHSHGHDTVEYAVEEWQAASRERLDELRQLVTLLAGQLQELAADVRGSAESLVARAGAGLLQELERTWASGIEAVAALDGVAQTLASYGFLEA